MAIKNTAEVIRFKYVVMKLKGRMTGGVTKILVYAISDYGTVTGKSAVLCCVSLS
jgi:hypothetical protein